MTFRWRNCLIRSYLPERGCHRQAGSQWRHLSNNKRFTGLVLVVSRFFTFLHLMHILDVKISLERVFPTDAVMFLIPEVRQTTAREQRTRMISVFIFQLLFFTTSAALSLSSLSASFLTHLYINTCQVYRCSPRHDMGMWLVRESCITHPHRRRNTHLRKNHICKNTHTSQ